MKPAVVMDTNVAIVANGGTAQAGVGCQQACIQALRQIQAGQCLLIDQNGLILTEYRAHLSPRGQPGVGDAFFKWLWNNQANEEVCRQIPLIVLATPTPTFAEFPSDPELTNFDHADRKFVAVVIKSGEAAPILNAADTDWWHFQAALARHNVQIQFICPELMVPHR